VDSAMPVRRQNASISASRKSAELWLTVHAPERMAALLYFASGGNHTLPSKPMQPFLPTLVARDDSGQYPTTSFTARAQDPEIAL
ncbi:MAG TPA: hypothetical protein VIQ99_03755, partial [Gammaproteobacteria bacterium]